MQFQIGRVFVRVNLGATLGSIKIIAPVDDFLMATWEIRVDSEDAVPVTVEQTFYARGDKEAEGKALDA